MAHDGEKLIFDTPAPSAELEAELASVVEAEIGLDVLARFDGRSRGRRPSKPPLHFEVVRDLVPEDAMEWDRAPARQVGEPGGTASLQKLRTIHHQIARMLALGEKQINISAILGITPARIQQLLHDPTFLELLDHYKTVEHEASVSIRHRFQLLGTTGLEELQDRLLNEPDSFGNGHLMELVKLSVGGEAPRASEPAARSGRTVSPEELEEIKRRANSQSRTAIEIRQPRTEGDS